MLGKRIKSTLLRKNPKELGVRVKGSGSKGKICYVRDKYGTAVYRCHKPSLHMLVSHLSWIDSIHIFLSYAELRVNELLPQQFCYIMGCASSLGHKAVHISLPLSETQKSLVRETWETVDQHKNNVGKKMFLR